MGGYAAFVWGAYGVGALVMIGLLAASYRRLRMREAAVAQLQPGPRRRRGEPAAGHAAAQESDGDAA